MQREASYTIYGSVYGDDGEFCFSGRRKLLRGLSGVEGISLIFVGKRV